MSNSWTIIDGFVVTVRCQCTRVVNQAETMPMSSEWHFLFLPLFRFGISHLSGMVHTSSCVLSLSHYRSHPANHRQSPEAITKFTLHHTARSFRSTNFHFEIQIDATTKKARYQTRDTKSNEPSFIQICCVNLWIVVVIVVIAWFVEISLFPIMLIIQVIRFVVIFSIEFKFEII